MGRVFGLFQVDLLSLYLQEEIKESNSDESDDLKKGDGFIKLSRSAME